MYPFTSGTIVSAGTSSPSIPGTQPVSLNISLASFRRAIHSLDIALLMVSGPAAATSVDFIPHSHSAHRSVIYFTFVASQIMVSSQADSGRGRRLYTEREYCVQIGIVGWRGKSGLLQ